MRAILSGIFNELIKLRIDAGDTSLKNHIEKGKKNALRTSPTIQNELIRLCGETAREWVAAEVKEANAFSVLADETADISGKEQLSVGVRFYDKKKEKR